MTKNMKRISLVVLFAILICATLAFTFNNRFLAADKTVDSYYISGSTESSVRYGKTDRTGDTQGVVATLAPKDSLVIRRVIDLKGKDKNDVLLSLIPAPMIAGSADFGTLKIKLIDVFDESNYITVQLRPYPQRLNTADVCYTLAAASNGQKFSALDRGGWWGHVDNWGMWTYFTFYGAPLNANKQDSFAISYECETKKLYVYEETTGDAHLVIDFDEVDYFGSNIWNGFTNDKVYMEVYCEDYEKSTATLLIKKYGDYDLSENKFTDEEGPLLTVDFDGYSEGDLPVGVVGKEYPVYGASAYDHYSGRAEVKTEVYRNYYGSDRAAVAVNSRKKTFTPSMSGEYYIVYSASDLFGNQTAKIVQVTVKSQDEVDDFYLSLGTYGKTVKVGDLVVVPDYEVFGNIGRTTTSINVVNGGKQLNYNEGVRPTKTGSLTVTVTVRDYVGQETSATMNINVIAADRPTFVAIPVLPDYFVEGNEYSFPAINAYDYTDGSGKAVPCVVRYRESGETNAKTISGKFIPKVSVDGKEIEIIYQATSNGKSAEYIKSIPVVKTVVDGKMDVTKFFKTTGNGQITSGSNSVVLSADDEAGFKFINSLYTSTFSASLSATSATGNIEKITYILTDYYDKKVELIFSYINKDGKYQFSLNGDDKNAIAISASLSGSNQLGVEYDDVERIIKYDSSSSMRTVSITADNSGKQFNGFNGHEFYLTIKVESKSGTTASVNLLKICGHQFSDATSDKIRPYIDLIGDYGGDLNLNDVFVLPKVIISDVLSGKTEGKLTVTDPDGASSKVTSVEGVLLDGVSSDTFVSIKLTKYGAYTVRYTASDVSGNALGGRAGFSYTINVVDFDEPTITLKNSVVKTAKVGERIYVPKATIADNKDKEIGYSVLVIAPNGFVNELKENSAGFTASVAGKYAVIYSAKDQAGNLSIVKFEVTVTEE